MNDHSCPPLKVITFTSFWGRDCHTLIDSERLIFLESICISIVIPINMCRCRLFRICILSLKLNCILFSIFARFRICYIFYLGIIFNYSIRLTWVNYLSSRFIRLTIPLLYNPVFKLFTLRWSSCCSCRSLCSIYISIGI